LKNLPILTKFLIIMAACAAFCLAVSVYSSTKMRGIDESYRGLLNDEATAAIASARANRNFQAVRATIGEIIMATDPAALARAKTEFDAARARVIEYLDTAIRILPQDKALADAKAETLRILGGACDNVVEAGMKTTDAASNQIFQKQYFTACQPEILALTNTMAQNTSRIIKVSQDESDALTAMTSSTIVTTLVGIVLGMALVAGGGVFVIRSTVAAPIRRLASTLSVLANGDLSAQIDGADRGDEVGTMAKAVQVLKDNGINARDIETKAASERSQTEAERARNAEADANRAAAMEQATSGLAEGLQHLAQGNLGFELTQPFAADFEGLRNNFNLAVGQLRETLSAVTDATRAIDGGSRELSSSASDLSKRTEQQAAALEETAAALDQITVNVKNSSMRTEEARAVALDANTSARQSGEVVANAVNAMQRIEASSSQISNIIGVIDEIAFQTNLLALNAGVEAARAGEAGKGFAVVAQEVRELAQRSAQAAKEIKDLIRASADEVDNGVKLVTATGEALKVIEEHVVSINNQLDAIATSAREQSVGLSEVNTAVNQMDQTTQQNAAMVEEATAASSSLAVEAEKLRHLVDRFQLGGHARAPGGRSVGAQQVAQAGRYSVARPARSGAGNPPSLISASASGRQVVPGHAPAASPARALVNKLARAVGATPAAADNWEEF